MFQIKFNLSKEVASEDLRFKNMSSY